MRIIIPILKFGHAGGNRVLSQLASEWVKSGHVVDFLCPDSSAEPYFPTRAGIIWSNGSENVSKQRTAIGNPGGWYQIKSLYRGLKAIGSEYDVVFANHSLTAWPVALTSCGAASKFYYVQAYEPEYYINGKTIKDYLISILSAFSYHLPLHRVVNSPIYFRYKNLRASQFVPPGIDLNIFQPTESIRNLEESKSIIIGCIGRHESSKGIVYVLRAFEELHKMDSRFLLRVAYGNLPIDWKHDHCEIVVPKNDKELADYYRSVDILVAPGTVQHGAPHYPVLEAGACGVAVVTTGYMGATSETAWIVPNRNVEAIVEAVTAIASNDRQRIEKRTKFLNAVRQFSWEQVSGEMLKIFEQKI